MGRITRDYLRAHRLCPQQCAPNFFRVLGVIDALDRHLGLGLTWYDVSHLYEGHQEARAGFYLKSQSNAVKLISCLPKSNKGMKDDFLKPCSGERPTLKVLIATSSKSPSILLNISQYLSAYAFTDSPSLIDMDSKESRGWGTLLHVMNREQNDWVSFLKDLMEFILSPSNHLIGIGTKLDGNTLHNRASSWEWTTIFYLNWLTCSTGSVHPLYMVNVGWWKRLGSFAFSIPWVKGDLEIWLRAFFITLVPTPLPDRLLRLLLWGCSSSQEKNSLGGVPDHCL